MVHEKIGLKFYARETSKLIFRLQKKCERKILVIDLIIYLVCMLLLQEPVAQHEF